MWSAEPESRKAPMSWDGIIMIPDGFKISQTCIGIYWSVIRCTTILSHFGSRPFTHQPECWATAVIDVAVELTGRFRKVVQSAKYQSHLASSDPGIHDPRSKPNTTSCSPTLLSTETIRLQSRYCASSPATPHRMMPVVNLAGSQS